VRLKDTGGKLCADKVEVDGIEDAVDGGAIALDVNQVFLFNRNRWHRHINFGYAKTPMTRRNPIFQFFNLCFDRFCHLDQLVRERLQKLCGRRTTAVSARAASAAIVQRIWILQPRGRKLAREGSREVGWHFFGAAKIIFETLNTNVG
jgi:hypothetical protein